MTLKWKKVDNKIYIAEAVVHYELYGHTTSAHLVFRIDGRPGVLNHNGYRVDVSKPFIPAFEAIDQGVPCKTVVESKEYAEEWLKEVSSQNTIGPKMPSRWAT